MALVGSTTNMVAISATIDGTDTGIWDKISGRTVDSEETKYRPGNMGQQIAIGGQKTIENITMSRIFDSVRDQGLARLLMGKVGRAKCTIKEQPLDVNGAAWGNPYVFTGRLKSVKLPDRDSEGTDAALWEIEISTDANVS